MKHTTTILFVCLTLILSSFIVGDSEQLTKADRKYLIEYFQQTKQSLLLRIENLSIEQWHYKSTPNRWSVAEVCEHITLAEQTLIKRAEGIIEHTHDLSKIDQTQAVADKILKIITDRSKTFQANQNLTPAGSYAAPDDYIQIMSDVRDSSIKYVKSTKDPLKAYYQENQLFGSMNGYHWLLFIPAHTERHIQQIQEILSEPNFPKVNQQ